MKTTENRIAFQTLLEITNPAQERNIYVHPNALAREIFWQRIDRVVGLVRENTKPSQIALDFGGGSGVMAKALSPHLKEIHIVDLDPNDARSIKDRFALENVRIFQEDIDSFSPPAQYDLVVAADVLEHFRDLSVPVRALRRVLKPNGLLIISVPTENWLYLLGRKLVRKQKPADHYHAARTIVNYLITMGFQRIKAMSAPQFGIRLPLFTVAIFKLI